MRASYDAGIARHSIAPASGSPAANLLRPVRRPSGIGSALVTRPENHEPWRLRPPRRK